MMFDNSWTFDELNRDVANAEQAYIYVTKDLSISMGVNGMYVEDAEIWLDHNASEKTLWFDSLDTLDEYVRSQYPDADWDE